MQHALRRTFLTCNDSKMILTAYKIDVHPSDVLVRRRVVPPVERPGLVVLVGRLRVSRPAGLVVA
jgi:hypothetical protein